MDLQNGSEADWANQPVQYYDSVIMDWPQNSCKSYATLLITQSRQMKIELTQIAFICGSDKLLLVYIHGISVENCLEVKRRS